MVDIQSYPWATAWKSCWSLIEGRMGLGTAGFPCVSLFFHTSLSLASQLLSSSSSLHLLFCCLGLLSSSFLHAASLNLFLALFGSFLLCAALPHFLSLSANSRCLIHQHLLKLCAVLCTNVVCSVCEFARWGKFEKVCKIMCMHVTVSSSHFWHAASPYASVRRQHGWQNLRCHGGMKP